MKYPEFLKKGDKIVLTALSAGVAKRDEEKKVRYFKAIDNLKKEWYTMVSEFPEVYDTLDILNLHYIT